MGLFKVNKLIIEVQEEAPRNVVFHKKQIFLNANLIVQMELETQYNKTFYKATMVNDKTIYIAIDEFTEDWRKLEYVD